MRHDPMNPSRDRIRAFYDEFMVSQMLNYRLTKNSRIRKAIARTLPFVKNDSKILEIGCGIGLVTEQLAKKARDGFVFACDISDRNIWYARQTVKAPNLEFRQLDVLSDFEKVQEWIRHPLDLVVMVDVLEHLPCKEHLSIFLNLRRVMSDKSTVVLTFPSPQHQRSLRLENPKELQIIDEIIELQDVATLANETGFSIQHFSFEHVWLTNQYIHCVLQASIEVHPLPAPQRRLIGKAVDRVRGVFEARILIPFRRRKYVTKIFRNLPRTWADG